MIFYFKFIKKIPFLKIFHNESLVFVVVNSLYRVADPSRL